MIGFFTALLGGLAFYSQSKYFPERFHYMKSKIPAWLGILILVVSQGIFIWQLGTVKGLLTGFMVILMAYTLLPFVFNLPLKYRSICLGIMVIFFIIQLLY